MNINTSIENIYQLDGTVPLAKAIPFGLQHILAMFVSNITPLVILAGLAGIDDVQTASLIQNCMIVAGLATLIQLYPIWKIGGKLPIVMGVSFAFVGTLSAVVTTYGYPTMLGAVLVGGIVEGMLGLFGQKWLKFISPVVSSCVVMAIGLSLLSVGVRSFGGGYSASFGSAENLLVGFVTLASVLIFKMVAKGFWKQLSVMFGLVVGYVLACILGMVDLSVIMSGGIISLPQLLPIMPEFNMGAIFSVVVVFFVSATETIGDATAIVTSGLNRKISDKEISGALACDGFASSMSSLFGCPPVTSFSQNVGLVAMTKVVNRFTIMTGAAIMLLAGLFPPIGNFFASVPDPVLGGCTIMMFGSIVVSGLEMYSHAGFNQRNLTISSLALSIGIGFTQIPEIFAIAPAVIRDVFSHNSVALVFVIALILSLVLPKEEEN